MDGEHNEEQDLDIETQEDEEQGFVFSSALVVYVTYIGSIILIFDPKLVVMGDFIAAGMAYYLLDECSDSSYEKSHYKYQIRSFLIISALYILTLMIAPQNLVLPILAVLQLWVVIRSVVGFMKAIKEQSLKNPGTLLIGR